MLFERAKTWSRTLRSRLAFWNAVAVFLVSVLVLVSVREGVRWTLLHELDAALFDDLEEIDLLIREVPSDNDVILFADLDRKARGHTHHAWFVQFLDTTGKPTWSSVGANNVLMEADKIPLGVPISWNDYRVIRSERTNAPDQRRFLVIASSLGSFVQDLQRMDKLVALIGLSALLIAPLGGFWLAGRATQPLAELIHTASLLRTTPLNDRLPVRHTGDEIDWLATTINSLLDRLSLHLQEKQDFLANAAHDLRTPLAAIRSTTEIALDSDRTVEEYRELLSDIIEQSESLELLVNQLLLLSEAEAELSKIHSERVALHDLVRSATEMFQAVADSHNLRIDVNIAPDIFVRGNRQHLRQVSNNLIDNAIKYSASVERQCPETESPPERIDVSLRKDEFKQLAVLTVEDQGPGIPSEHLGRIFERFYRVNRARSREGTASGTGLGLSICHAIVTAHHGTIVVESLQGVRTRFTVTLPLDRS